MSSKRYECCAKEEILTHFHQNEMKGYDIETVLSQRLVYGLNELEKEEKTPIWKLLMEQFDDILVKILLFAACFSFLLAFFDGNSNEGFEAYVEPIVILVILILNAIVGVWQESNAEAALDALKDLQSETAYVLRDGELSIIPSRDLVPGDLVEIRVGDKVPADIRLLTLKTTSMRIEQAQMTGESTSVNKIIEPLPTTTENLIQSKKNILFASTTVVSGHGRGIVIETGMRTEIGKIQASVQQASEEEEDTPLKQKLDEFGNQLSKVIGVICILVWVVNYPNFSDPAHGTFIRGGIYYFKIAIALAVAAIPEGLPAVITTCLALGTRKMAKKNAIVRKLPSVETLGCTTVICSDKTGTLTTNEMSCVMFSYVADLSKEPTVKTFAVEGHTYSPIGEITPKPEVSKIPGDKIGTNIQHVLQYFTAVATLCNEASIEYHQSSGKFTRLGEPTEAALKVLAEKIGRYLIAKRAEPYTLTEYDANPQLVKQTSDLWQSYYQPIATLEFTRSRKSMSVLCKPKVEKRGNILVVKGAPESILARCTHVQTENGKITPLTQPIKTVLMERINEAAKKSFRCLALAIKTELPEALATYTGKTTEKGYEVLKDTEDFEKLETGLTFLGFVGIIDPARPEVAPMVARCKDAGIRIMVITGDNKITAEAICQSIEVLPPGISAEDLAKVSFTGLEFFQLTKERQYEILASGTNLIFSRAEPIHKQMLVKMLKSQQEIVAMTGDGVNDAPALKQADIGIAMGISGTEVAKEAADMVLSDDNFATIVFAVEEGRSIYNNMQAFIRYLISSNIGEVAAIFFTALLGLPDSLIPVQLLWVNLVTDGLPATALGFNPPDIDIMKRPPRDTKTALITSWVFFRYLVIGIYVGIACVGSFVYWYMYVPGEHTLVSWYQLTHWSECAHWNDFTVNNMHSLDLQSSPCRYFSEGKTKPSSISLSVLVTIEMLNALNALSEDQSLFIMYPWSNIYLIGAVILSVLLHCMILYVPFFNEIFNVMPLTWNDWMIVLMFSLPVVLIDEVLKYYGRRSAEAYYKKQRRLKDINEKKSN